MPKITALTNYAALNSISDVLPIVDILNDETKKIAWSVLQGLITNLVTTFRWGISGTGLRLNNGGDLITIDALGKVGIGVTSPGAKLDISGNIATSLKITNAQGAAVGIDLTGLSGGYAFSIANNQFIRFADIGGTQQIVLGISTDDNTKLFSKAGKNIDIHPGNASPVGIRVETTGNVGVGTVTPNANALLDITSTTKAFMPPRMTTVQKAAIASPTAGMVVYDSTLNKLCIYTTAWETITSV